MHFIENSHIPLFQTFNHSYSVIKVSISFWDNLEVSSLGTHRVRDIKKSFAFMHLFICQIFLMFLLCARYSSRCLDIASVKN